MAGLSVGLSRDSETGGGGRARVDATPTAGGGETPPRAVDSARAGGHDRAGRVNGSVASLGRHGLHGLGGSVLGDRNKGGRLRVSPDAETTQRRYT